MLRKLKLVCVFLAALGSLALGQASRHFTFHYAFSVKDVSRDQRVRIWFPAAHSDAYQDVRVLSASGDLPLKRTRESRFQNEMYYAESAKPQSSDLHFEVVYDVVRHEHLTLGLN